MRPGFSRSRILGLLAVLLLASYAQGADRGKRLAEIQREIEEREARARSYAEQAHGYLGELDGIDRRLSETRRSVRRLRQRQQAAEKELRAARKGLAQASRALEATRKDLETRLIALYKFGTTGGIPALYSARDFQSFARRRQSLARVLEQDTHLFARHRDASSAWESSRDRSQSLVAEVRAAQREIGGREERLRRNLVERRNLVALLRSRSDREERAADELRQAAKRLGEALARMPSGYTPPTGRGLVRGNVPWPVEGALRSRFGEHVDPEFGTKTRRSGIEIAAGSGTDVHAVAMGRVLFAGWFRGYGQLVILDHGQDSVSVSGYLDEITIEAGASVKTGDAIGTVGNTGSLSGPGLYFEIRHDGKAVDPRGWLAPRAREGKR